MSISKMNAISDFHKPENPEAKQRIKQIEVKLNELVELLENKDSFSLSFSSRDFKALVTSFEESLSPFAKQNNPPPSENPTISIWVGRCFISLKGK